MDFWPLKAKFNQFKEKAIEITDKTIEMTAKKISESTLVMKTQNEFETFISKSENKKFINDKWEEKIFTKRVFIVFWDSKQDFFKEFMLSLPVLLTKSFSQNISFKVVDISNKEINYSLYELKDFPTLLVFENKEMYKSISWEENLRKIVNSLTLDINKTIEEL